MRNMTRFTAKNPSSGVVGEPADLPHLVAEYLMFSITVEEAIYVTSSCIGPDDAAAL